MYCKSCGLQIENDSRYCRRCGSEVTGEISGDFGTPPDVTRRKIFLAVAISILILLTAAVFMILQTVEESPDSRLNTDSVYKALA